MDTATLTSKSQITLPKSVREALGAAPGDRVRFVPGWHGFHLVLIKGDVTALRGVFKGRRKSSLAVAEMNRAVAEMGSGREPRELIGIDSNVLVRYLARDDARQAALATRFIEQTLSARRKGHISLVALAELAWVLRSRYQVARDELAQALVQLIADERFQIQDESAVWSALDLYRQQPVDFGDALIAAVDRLHGCRKTVTFDRGATRIDRMELLTA